MPTLVDVSQPDNLEDERWQAHQRAHARDQEVADKAARDVKEALDKAAIEVTGRLTEVRAYIDQVLKSHADLHGADREALLLARGVLEKELKEINNVREQLASDRAVLPTGDMVRTLIAGMKAEVLGVVTSTSAGAALEAKGFREDMQRSEARIRAIEVASSNLNGRLTAVGTAVVGAVGLLEFLFRGGHIGP